MTATSLNKITYEDLYTLPDNMIGEIIDGELVAMPRPSFHHSNVVSGITDEIKSPFQRGRGGPGGWVILYEYESIRIGDCIMERIIRLHIEKLPEGVYLATSDDVQGLVAQGRTVVETVEIARDVAKRLFEAAAERKEMVFLPEVADTLEYLWEV